MTINNVSQVSQPTMPAQPVQIHGGLVASYSPVGMTRQAARLRSQLIGSGISFVIALAFLLAGIFYWKMTAKEFFFWLFIFSLALSSLRLVVNIVELVRARRAIRRINLGPAVQILPAGVVTSSLPAGRLFRWDEIHSIRVKNARFVPGPKLEILAAGKQYWRVPMINLDVNAQELDSALRVFSLGKFGLNLSKTDDLW